MAENESLDLGGSYSKRWNVPCEAVRKREPCADVARKLELALIGGLRRTLVQCEKEYGVSLSDLVATRIVPRGQSQKGVIDLLARYRDEWLAVAATARRNGHGWATWIAPVELSTRQE